jgi:ribosomal protein L28
VHIQAGGSRKHIRVCTRCLRSGKIAKVV